MYAGNAVFADSDASASQPTMGSNMSLLRDLLGRAEKLGVDLHDAVDSFTGVRPPQPSLSAVQKDSEPSGSIAGMHRLLRLLDAALDTIGSAPSRLRNAHG